MYNIVYRASNFCQFSGTSIEKQNGKEFQPYSKYVVSPVTFKKPRRHISLSKNNKSVDTYLSLNWLIFSLDDASWQDFSSIFHSKNV